MRDPGLTTTGRGDPADIRDEIIAMAAEALDRPMEPGPVTGRTEFASLGVDSTSVFEILLKIETRFRVTLPDDFLFRNRTPDDVARALSTMPPDSGAGTP